MFVVYIAKRGLSRSVTPLGGRTGGKVATGRGRRGNKSLAGEI
jgi:hypothetical protein